MRTRRFPQGHVGAFEGGVGFFDLQADDCVKSDRSASVRCYFALIR